MIFSDRIGELSTRSGEFRVRWAAHNVQIHTTGVKLIHHPIVGDLELAFESFSLATDPSQSLLTYIAEPGSASQDALNRLASELTARVRAEDVDNCPPVAQEAGSPGSHVAQFVAQFPGDNGSPEGR